MTESASDRILMARLKYTRVKRGGGELAVCGEYGSGLAWFDYQVCGLRTGVAEGVMLGRDQELDHEWLQSVVDATGASLIKLTRALPGPATPALALQSNRRWRVIRRATQADDLLNLGSSYEATLAALGKHTRRNLRLAGKVIAAERLSFEVSTGPELLPWPVRSALSRKTKPKGLRRSAAGRLEAAIDATSRPFRSVVRTTNGDVVSYCCGYFGEPSTAYLLYQLNNSAYHKIGPSLLHRSLLMRWLIERNCTELVFVHGCVGILRHACQLQPLEVVWLMRRSPLAYSRAALIGLAGPEGREASIGELARLGLAGEVRRAASAMWQTKHT